MTEMTRKITIALGAATRQDVMALVVARGLGSEIPQVCVHGDAVVLACDALTPGATIAPALRRADVAVYRVRVHVRGEATLEARDATRTATFRTAPFRALPSDLADLPGGLSFVLGTCAYYSPPDLRRWAVMMRGSYGLGATPAFAVLAGDNVYLDVPKPHGQTPDDVAQRYLRYFLDDGYMHARASMPTFLTFDDHEYWNDYPERELPVSIWLSECERIPFQQAARECLDLFQRSISPAPQSNTRFAYQVDISPVSLFVVDTRSERGLAADASLQLMPDEDLQALECWARELRGPGILVIGQPLWIDPLVKIGPIPGDHNVSYFRPQYERICRALEDAPFDVMVCSGDVHYSRALRIQTRRRRPLYELVSSPLVSIPTSFATLAQYALGGLPPPACESRIQDTTRPPFDGWQATYLTGTDSSTVFSQVSLRPAAQGVAVGLAFVDTRERGPAELTPTSPLGRAELYAGPGRDVCVHQHAFTLGRKLTL